MTPLPVMTRLPEMIPLPVLTPLPEMTPLFGISRHNSYAVRLWHYFSSAYQEKLGLEYRSTHAPRGHITGHSCCTAVVGRSVWVRRGVHSSEVAEIRLGILGNSESGYKL